MRKRLLIIISMAFLFLSLFSGCFNSENKEIDITKAVENIKSEVTFPEMVKVSQGDIANYYTFDMDKIDEVFLEINASGGFPDEILIIKFKADNDYEKIKESIEARKHEITNTFKDYQPQEMYKLDQAIIERKNNYLAFVVSDDSSKAKEIFKDSFLKN